MRSLMVSSWTRPASEHSTATAPPFSPARRPLVLVATADPVLDYARTVTAYPDRAAKQDLLAAVCAIPGNERATLDKLANWFARHRATRARHRTPVLPGDESIRASPLSPPSSTHPRAVFPKLTPHLHQLRVLYQQTRHPTEGIVAIWAKRFGVDQEEITAWIEYQQEKAKVSASPVSPVAASPHPHLPTPAKSLSPQARMPSLPPIAIKEEPDTRPVLEGLPPLSRQPVRLSIVTPARC